jgi:5-methyltetrahydropteroyltriglutamate--homocysteine methyltransferase
VLNATAGRLLPTTITGSIPRPSWFDRNLGRRTFREAMGDSRYREQYIDAVSSHLRDQERAGLEILTDGDCRFDIDVGGMSWFSYPARRLEGMAGNDYAQPGYGSAKGTIIFEAIESRVLPRCVGKIGRGDLQYADIWRAAQELTSQPVKFGTITPEVLGLSVANDAYTSRRDLIDDLSRAMNAELMTVAEAGCPAIQLEEPNVHLASIRRRTDLEEMDVDYFVDVFNGTVAGLREHTEVWCHTCWGNAAQQRLFDEAVSYATALEHLDRLDVDVLTFECASADGLDLSVIGSTISADKKIAIGVVDHRNLQVESPERVARLLRDALRHIPPERLIISSDCGFGREGMTRRIAFYKMIAIAKGTNIVRTELGIPTTEVRSAESRFGFTSV